MPSEKTALDRVLEAARLKRNVFILNKTDFPGKWVAVPQEDFDELQDSLAAFDASEPDAMACENHACDDCRTIPLTKRCAFGQPMTVKLYARSRHE